MPNSDCPVPNAVGFCEPEGTGVLGVLILGEAMGEAEAADGLPFRPHAAAGSVLERAIRRSGYSREQFVLYNTVPVQPPRNFLEGAPYEDEAVAWGMQFVDSVVEKHKPRCILALGNVALRAVTGMTGQYQSITHLRGFVLSSNRYGIPVVGSLHPAFLRRGAMAYMGVLMHDLKLAVAVANTKPGGSSRFFSPVLWRDVVYVPMSRCDPSWTPPGYVTHPTERDAWEFLKQAEAAKPFSVVTPGHKSPRCPNPDNGGLSPAGVTTKEGLSATGLITYDIETPRSASTDEEGSDELEDREIVSIQFSLAPHTGIFFPFRDPFIEVARRIMALPHPKAGANSWRFDDPLLEAHGFRLNGERHDVRWTWHHLQPDLSGALQFIASFYAREIGPWKHTHMINPPAYGIKDVDAVQQILTEAQ